MEPCRARVRWWFVILLFGGCCGGAGGRWRMLVSNSEMFLYLFSFVMSVFMWLVLWSLWYEWDTYYQAKKRLNQRPVDDGHRLGGGLNSLASCCIEWPVDLVRIQSCGIDILELEERTGRRLGSIIKRHGLKQIRNVSTKIEHRTTRIEKLLTS